MGYYTSFNLTIKLVGMPKEEIEALELLSAGYDCPALDYEFFRCERREAAFRCRGDDNVPASVVKRCRDGGVLLTIRSCFKDYGNETGNLCEWLAPYVVAPEPLKCGSVRGEEGSGYPVIFHDGKVL